VPTEGPPPPTAPVAEPTQPPAPPTQSPLPATATSTAIPPTATPTDEPSATAAPEPSATPSPPACPAPLAGGFGRLWNENAQVRDRIGCPLEPEQGGASTTAEQPFERGSMFYYDPLARIYVLFGKDSGRWRVFEQRELRDLPTPTPAPNPPCSAPLVSGFGLVWGTFQEVRETLGCATGPEDGLFEGAYQPFQNGAMLFSNKGLGRGKTLYVLYANGSFDRYDDPNQ
jgi:serine/threonine-protein kinase